MNDPFSNAARFLMGYGPGAMFLALVIIAFIYFTALDNPVRQSHLKFALLCVLIGGLVMAAAAPFVLPYLQAINPAIKPVVLPTATP